MFGYGRTSKMGDPGIEPGFVREEAENHNELY